MTGRLAELVAEVDLFLAMELFFVRTLRPLGRVPPTDSAAVLPTSCEEER